MEAITSSAIKPNTVTPTINVGVAAQATKNQTEIPTQSANHSISEKEVKQAINEVTLSLGNANESIGFSYEKKLGQLFVLVTDNKSGEVIREVPSKDFIKHKLAMQEMIGLLLDKQV